jgi:NADPH2:quinone reductase
LLKTASIVGVFWGDFAMRNPKENMENTMTLMKWYDEGRLRPHIHKTYELKEASRALEEIINRKVRGKLVIKV